MSANGKKEGQEEKKGTEAEEYSEESYRAQRKKEFLEGGLFDMEEKKILELLLFYGIPRKDVRKITERLLRGFGSIPSVLDAPYEELQAIDGISSSTAVLLRMIPSLCRIYMKDKYDRNPQLQVKENVNDILLTQFVDSTLERFVLILLDKKDRVILCKTLAEGSISSVIFDERAILTLASQPNAECAVIAHNHPSGNLCPSMDDVRATENIIKMLDLINVRLLSHVIVCGKESKAYTLKEMRRVAKKATFNMLRYAQKFEK